MSKQHLRRPRFQRAFINWFKQKHALFDVQISVTKISRNGIELLFVDYPDYLSVWLGSEELSVDVNWQGQWWDSLIWYDAISQRWNKSLRFRAPTSWPASYYEGYVCKYCLQDGGDAVLSPNPEALWQNHLFAPFLEWGNRELAPGRWLQIAGVSASCTYSKLIKHNDDLEGSKCIRIALEHPQLKEEIFSEEEAGVVSNWLLELPGNQKTQHVDFPS